MLRTGLGYHTFNIFMPVNAEEAHIIGKEINRYMADTKELTRINTDKQYKKHTEATNKENRFLILPAKKCYTYKYLDENGNITSINPPTKSFLRIGVFDVFIVEERSNAVFG